MFTIWRSFWNVSVNVCFALFCCCCLRCVCVPEDKCPQVSRWIVFCFFFWGLFDCFYFELLQNIASEQLRTFPKWLICFRFLMFVDIFLVYRRTPLPGGDCCQTSRFDISGATLEKGHKYCDSSKYFANYQDFRIFFTTFEM